MKVQRDAAGSLRTEAPGKYSVLARMNTEPLLFFLDVDTGYTR